MTTKNDKGARPIASMTGFARVSGRIDGSGASADWIWELRSVNGRGLDARFRLPAGYDHLEAELRRTLAAVLTRGHVNASLTLSRGACATRYVINEDMLQMVRRRAEALAKEIGSPLPAAEALLAVRGVVEQDEAALDEKAQRTHIDALKAGFGQAVAMLAEARGNEGAALEKVIGKQIDEISRFVAAARAEDSASLPVIKMRITAQLDELLKGGEPIAAERLAQEAALLAVKADIREELDRLDGHIDAARALLAKGGPVGRKLDFLTQEFNREANTLCSKAAGLSMKQIGLDLRAVIDQMREQVQNVE